MKTFVLFVAFCSLLCGCDKPVERAPRWQYKTLIISDDSMTTMKSEDDNRFSKVDLQKELKNYLMADDYGSEWEVCGCFLEPKKDPRLIVLLKKRE